MTARTLAHSKPSTAREREQIDVLDKLVWLLTDEELDAMSKADQKVAIDHRAYLKDCGALITILANPPGTKFESVWDKDAKGWRLRPLQ